MVGPKSGKWLNEIHDREISSTRNTSQTSAALRTETYSSYLKRSLNITPKKIIIYLNDTKPAKKL